MTKRQILAFLKARQKIIAKARDDLRDVFDNIEEQIDSADSALQDLDCCIDKLSELL